MRKRSLLILIGLMPIAMVGSVAAAVSEVKYDSQTNLVSIVADKHAVISLLDQVADTASFTLVADEGSMALSRKISISLERVPLGRAISLMLGNVNRVVTYSSDGRAARHVEKVEIISSVKDTYVSSVISNDNVKSNSAQSSLGENTDSLSLSTLRRQLKERRHNRTSGSMISEKKLLAHIDGIQKKLMGDDEGDINSAGSQALSDRILASD